jgi:hypothetical protein
VSGVKLLAKNRINSSPRDATELTREDTFRTLSTAQRRFTPVGLVKIKASADLRSCDLACFKSLPLTFIAARAKPYAPTTPISGAPLTFIERIAAQTWSTVRIRTYTNLPGSFVVSIASSIPFFHRTGSSESRSLPDTPQNSVLSILIVRMPL